MQAIDGIFYVMVLIMSVVVHEFAHGYVAYLLGDNTARAQGRLTLNPIKHLDIYGSVIVPLLLVLGNAGFMFGWAKPVPYNPNNLRNGKYGKIWVAIAGILANIFLAVIFSLLLRFGPHIGLPDYYLDPKSLHPLYKICITIVFTNLGLALFNLIPIPPLDGSKILLALIPYKYRHIENILERGGIFFLYLLMGLICNNSTLGIYFHSKLSALIYMVFSALTGAGF